MNKKIIKGLFIGTLMLVSLFFAGAVSTDNVINALPVIGQSNWGNPILLGFNHTLNLFRVSHTENGTLKKGLNVSFDELNISQNLIVMGDIRGELPNGFKVGNWTALYNFEADTRYKLVNFTSNYDTRLDRFANANFTSQLELRLSEFFNQGNFTIAYNNRADRFGSENFTIRYDSRTDRYGKENFTAQIDSNGFFKLQNYSAEYSSTGYKSSNFTNNYDSRTDRFGVLNGTSLPFSRFTIENGTALPFSNFKGENVSANEQNPSNATIFLPSQEKVDGLKSADSPRFVGINVSTSGTGVRILSNASDPIVDSVVAPRGSLFMQTNGTLYVKEGAGDTAWVSK